MVAIITLVFRNSLIIMKCAVVHISPFLKADDWPASETSHLQFYGCMTIKLSQSAEIISLMSAK